MADHYAVLGVDRSASRDEVRRAYLRLARRSHPDRVGPEGEARMQAVNEAWRVLGDVELRAAYDRQLRRSGPPSGSVERSEPDWAAWEAELTDDGDEPADDGLAPGLHRVLRVLPMAVVVLALVGVFVFTAYARSTDSGPAIREVGSCILVEADGFRRTPCNAVNDGMITQVVSGDAPCRDDTDRRYDLPSGTGAYCLAATLDTR